VNIWSTCPPNLGAQFDFFKETSGSQLTQNPKWNVGERKQHGRICLAWSHLFFKYIYHYLFKPSRISNRNTNM